MGLPVRFGLVWFGLGAGMNLSATTAAERKFKRGSENVSMLRGPNEIISSGR